MKSLKRMRKNEKEKFVIPKSVQDVIPIKAVYKDGIFLVGNNLYSKTFKFTDINYNIASDEDKQELMKGYWAVINSFGAGVTVKMTINNHQLDRAEFEKSILLRYEYDGLDNYRKEYNDMLLDKAALSNCIVQDKYFTVTVSKKSIDDARAFFNRVGNDLTARLSRIDSKCLPVNAEERLRIFHNFYRSGDEQNYNLDLEQREAEILEVKNDMRNRDQRLYSTLITMVITADTKQELDNVTDTVFSMVSNGSTAQFAILRYQQLDGLNTVLPFGVRRINCFRTLTTESLAAFMPFNAQEVRHAHGTYYGQNTISGNMIFVNRNQLLNGNCIVLGVSGGGKSFFVKEDATSIILANPNADVLIIDPEREYNLLVNALGGEVVNISSNSENHINAMDMNKNYEDDKNPIATKSEFIMSLCEQLIGGTVGPKDKSIIDRCCRNVYANYIKSGYKITPPTLKDFREELLNQPETEAQELALALELFTDGSLNTFAQPTNVDINNRLICYDILDLGEQLLPVGMLVVLDNIFNRITSNRTKGRTTYIFIDEIYLLFAQKYTADFLYRVWKRVRKYGAFATGITQNVGDMLQSNTARTMLANSEFTVMLNQNGSDRLDLSKLLNISDNQTEFFTNVQAGHGLMKIGGHFVPYANEFPKNTELYKLMTTKPGEA